jgi:acetyl esterase/lipase
MIHRMAFHRRLGLGLGLVLLALGLWLTWVDRSDSIRSQAIQVARNPQQSLTGRLYLPSQTSLPHPTLMLWHGVSCTKETMEPMAIALAQQGIAVLAFDAGGFGESYDRSYSNEENLADARAIAAYVYAHPNQFDPNRVGVGGHSMGGATALFLANEDSRIKTAIILGMSADITRFLPSNLFMGIGLYEQFHTPDAMRSTLQQGTEPTAKESQLYGDFTRGTARKLIISPTSDHLMEPFDPTLIRESVAWARQVFDIKTPLQPPIEPGILWSQFLVCLGSLLSASYALRDNSYARNHRRFVAISLAAMVLLILTFGITRHIPDRLTTDLILLAAIVLPMSHFAIQRPAELTPCFSITGLYAVVVVLSYTIVAVVLRGDELIRQPALILGLPQFMLQLPIALIYSRTHELRATLFPVYSNGVMPSWALILLFLPDLIKPGLILDGITRAAVWSARWLRQPLQIQWKASPSGRSLQLLAGSIVLLLVMVYQQVQSGAFPLEYAWTALRLLVQMALLPALLIWIMMRSPFLQAIETHCWKSR